MKYFLVYSEKCTPCIKYLSSKKKALEFASKFSKKNKYNTDSWIDFLVKGSIDLQFNGFSGYKEQ
jgi:hypothetical protein